VYVKLKGFTVSYAVNIYHPVLIFINYVDNYFCRLPNSSSRDSTVAMLDVNKLKVLKTVPVFEVRTFYFNDFKIATFFLVLIKVWDNT